MWLVATYHKTGTVLNAKLLRAIEGDSYVKCNSGCKELNVSPLHMAASGTHILRMTHGVYVRTREEWEVLLERSRQGLAERGVDRVRGVLWVRDPLEVILSGFFYHRVSHEQWLLDPGYFTREREMYEYFNKTRRSTCARMQCGPAASTAFSTVRNGSLPLGHCNVCQHALVLSTYQQILLALPIEAGVMLEAHRALSALQRMEREWGWVRGGPDTMVVDLDSIRGNAYNGTFARVFSFLGADDVDACVALASTFDINLHPPTGSGEHVFDESLGEQKEACRARLLQSAWYAQNVQPIRVRMGYPPPSPPTTTAPLPPPPLSQSPALPSPQS